MKNQPDATVDINIAKALLDYINASWTPYHAVEEASRRLHAAGFEKLSERQPWHGLKKGGRYYFTRNASTIVAFAVGGKYEAGNGFHMVGAHTDSPCLKLKPHSKGVKAGFLTVNVEPYGGGLWHTWFDRDLSVAGRVLVREQDRLVQKLVKVARPIMRIPMLAIHLYREIGEQGFKPNKQNHVVPVLATALLQEKKSSEPHHPALLRLLANELKCSTSDIVDFELNVCDTQPGVIGGLEDEFLFVGRLDNLAMSYLSLRALIDSTFGTDALAEETAIKAVALFDHEEVGSASAQGAGGPVMRDTITRVSQAFSEGAVDAPVRAIQNSFLVSADMAHALHPNYADKHEPDHKPQFHKGLVLKHNVHQRYATNAVSATLFRELAKRRGIPTQEFCVRSDMACGSTIGPILASGLGCRTVDVGAPQLSMHSIREMCAVDDMSHTYNHFCAFFKDFSALDASIDVDDLPLPNIEGTITDVPCNHMH
ncbi:peptidase M18, aminopeptidase I [Coccomyxa subellipsoidea C-169]|uniref:aspartyl aminopeptidase n=1 Tax=Coccomyxa subellipsoidea (strain C-169) TaxID=574566 RepID=I0YYW8_COCSC|nr:peptidase M18, aminopeptidase I [Coccomyxa subellipsoidea C-169]EIE23587.1 peptidase M18, aminopeptidase I [Coccomyxa subellipsoidea C-169]|eukprot:XP_005648131.1 peptidase M18, aminopeptidase I [Coccomyxa subellipsoidea C-169]